MTSQDAQQMIDVDVERPEEPEATPPPARRRIRRWSWILDLLRANAAFVVAFALGVALRVYAMLGFRPALLDNDSFEYLGVARRMSPYPIRPDGYSAFLRLLEPLHRLWTVVALQHLMGLTVAALLYALLRHWGVPGWLATLGVLPQLLDWHIVHLEHMVLSDTLFELLLAAAVVVLAWRPHATLLIAAGAGLLLALATLTRTTAVPLVILGGLYLVIRWPGWRPVAAFAVAALLPLGAYATWYHADHGRYEITTSDGIFLYSRVMLFADCAKISPPTDLAVLCDSRPVGDRGQSSNYIWHASPLDNLPGVGGEDALPAQRFTAQRNDAARRFAIRAIVRQPGDYVSVVWHDFVETFAWVHDPHRSHGEYLAYHFSSSPFAPKVDRVYVAGATGERDLIAYDGVSSPPRAVTPFATTLIQYQRFGYVPGIAFAVLVLLGASGLFAWRRRDERRWPILWIWLGAAAILVTAPMTAQFAYRYVLLALPLVSVASALSVSVIFGLGRPPGPVADSNSSSSALPAGEPIS